MRISERQRYQSTNDRISKARNDNMHTLEELSSNKKINRISDDPGGATKVIREKVKLADIEQLQKSVTFSKGFMERTETSLSAINDRLSRAKELAIQQANSTYGPDSRTSVGEEISEIINEIVGLSNATYNNRYVLSGFRTQTPALNPDGQFLGDDGAIFVQIEPGKYQQINLQPRKLFEADPDEREKGHFDLIHTLDILKQGLTENDPQMIQKSIDELDFQMTKVITYQSMMGARSLSLEQAEQRLELAKEQSMETKSKVEESDFYKASSDFRRTENVLQGTLLASNKLLQPSLLNFMQ